MNKVQQIIKEQKWTAPTVLQWLGTVWVFTRFLLFFAEEEGLLLRVRETWTELQVRWVISSEHVMTTHVVRNCRVRAVREV